MRLRLTIAAAALVLVPTVGLLAGPAGTALADTVMPPLDAPSTQPFIGNKGVAYIMSPDGKTYTTLPGSTTGKPTLPMTTTPSTGVGSFFKWLPLGLLPLGEGSAMDLSEFCTGDNTQAAQDMCAQVMTSQGLDPQQALFSSDATLEDINGQPLPGGWDRQCRTNRAPVAPLANDLATLPVDCNGSAVFSITYQKTSSPAFYDIVSAPVNFNVAGITLTGTRTINIPWTAPGTGLAYVSAFRVASQLRVVCRRPSTGTYFNSQPLTAGTNPQWNAIQTAASGTAVATCGDPTETPFLVYWEDQMAGYVPSSTQPPIGSSLPSWQGGVLWRADGLTVPSAGDYVAGVVNVAVECTDGTGLQTITASGAVQVKPGDPFAIPEALCPPGWVAVGSKVGWTPDGGSPQPLVESELDPNTKEMVELAPDCFNGNQQCVLELKQLLGGQLLSCGSIGQLCPDWASDPDAPSHYQCFYGGTSVDLNVCSAYRAPWIGKLPNLDAAGNILPYTAPIPTGLPTYTGPGVPQSDPRAECAASKPPSFWDGFSPYWIYKGAQCAMIDVFVPRPAIVQTKVAQTMLAWQATPPGKIVLWVQDSFDEMPVVEGCEGPRIPFNIEFGWISVDVPDYPLSACETPMSTIAAAARTIGAAAMLFGTGMALTRYINSIVNAPQIGRVS